MMAFGQAVLGMALFFERSLFSLSFEPKMFFDRVSYVLVISFRSSPPAPYINYLQYLFLCSAPLAKDEIEWKDDN